MGDVVLEWDQCGLWICRVMSWGWPMLRLIYLGVSENQFRWIVTGKVSGGFSGEAIGLRWGVLGSWLIWGSWTLVGWFSLARGSVVVISISCVRIVFSSK